MEAEYYPPKEDVILQNEAPTEAYILVSGAVDFIVKINGQDQVRSFFYVSHKIEMKDYIESIVTSFFFNCTIGSGKSFCRRHFRGNRGFMWKASALWRSNH